MTGIPAERLQTEGAYYVFDAPRLRERMEYLRGRLPEGTGLCYAVKANTFIIREALPYADRLEICSPGEARVCFGLGVPSEKTVISGVYKTPSFIRALAADRDFCGIFTAESEAQYRLLCEEAEKNGRELRVLLRLTNGSQFGMDAEQIETIVAERGSHPQIRLQGIQYFSGTQKTGVKKIGREIGLLDAFLTRLSEEYGFAAEELEYGPGFPAVYFEEDAFNEEEYLNEVSALLTGMTNRPKLVLELGRSIAAGCGTYYTHIVDLKTNGGQNYALTDGGMHHLVYYGQYMAMKRPRMALAGKPADETDEKYNICGALCSMNDIMVKQVPLHSPEVGDVLRFENTGAYCPTEGISLFLSRDLPAVYIRRETGETVCVRRNYETAALNTPDYGKEK